MAGQQFSAELNALREALPALPTPTPLPFSPRWLLGLCPLRTDFAALVDLRAYLRDAHPDNALGKTLEEAETGLASAIEQALLVGEAGQLIAFGVDRIGEISNERDPQLAADLAFGHPIPERYVKGMYSPGVPDGDPIIALHLLTIHADVVTRLEEWSRDA
jgi:chemotaxis signal transduction protein